MKKILVPIDFSKVSGLATDFAIDLAKKSNAEIIFLNSVHYNYFIDFPVGIGVNIQSIVAEVGDAMDIRMKEFIEQLDVSTEVSYRISHLHLLEAVKEITKEENIGLVIMGTQGSSGWSEFLIGSNTEKIVRWSECPVISVPNQTSFDSIKRILVPIDLKELQEGFMDHLSRLQRLFSATMDFVWVKTPHNIENEDLVKKEVESLIEKASIKNAHFSIVKFVFPTDGIFNQVEERKADMIAMATHSRRGIAHWLNGSITEDTINHVHVPVWTFKIDKESEKMELFSVDEAKRRAQNQTKTAVL